MARFQVTIADMILLSTLVGGVVGAIGARAPQFAFISFFIVGINIWHRRFWSQRWAISAIILGAGALVAGLRGNHSINLPDGDLAGWGAALVAGGITLLLMSERLYEDE